VEGREKEDMEKEGKKKKFLVAKAWVKMQEDFERWQKKKGKLAN
jgi:hypothetical protein